jgi:hypothetical protein
MKTIKKAKELRRYSIGNQIVSIDTFVEKLFQIHANGKKLNNLKYSNVLYGYYIDLCLWHARYSNENN